MNANWKSIRVFISSTFRDMQSERDHLVRFVFPRLREELLKWRIHFIDVDLRWGVTSEQDAQTVCREVIDKCRPRFLCMLGGRYGSVPPGKTRSITAEEVHYAVLDRPLKDRGFAYFYFRDDAATTAMVETTPGDLREPPGSDNQGRLTELKQTIINAGLNPFIYPTHWDNESRRLTSLKEFGDRVYDDLLAGMKVDPAIQDRFLAKAAVQPNEFDEENAAMEAFVEERSERFVIGSRESVLNELLINASAKGSHGYICLTGAPGIGKSALLAYLSRHEILNNQPSILLISHFIGASPGSAEVRHLLRRLCHELKAGYPDITANIPDDLEKLRITFLDFLKQTSKKKRVVIIIDAIDQLNITSNSTGFPWLPNELPENILIVISALDGPTINEFRYRTCKPCEIELKPLTFVDGEQIIEQFSIRYSKQLESDQHTALLAKADSCTPLYLQVALEELRTLGTFEEITQRINEFPPKTNELFAWILDRLEKDNGFRDAKKQVGQELVSRFVAFLGVSRHGLSQRELSELLDIGDTQGNVAALLHLLRPYLMLRGELIDFFHGQFQLASRKKYLATADKREAAHAALAKLFNRLADPEGESRFDGSTRALDELPYHSYKRGNVGENIPKPEELLVNLKYLHRRCKCSNIYKLIDDYDLVPNPTNIQTEPFRLFLRKHSQLLSEYRDFFSLYCHEASKEGGERIECLPSEWPWPYLKSEKLNTPEVSPRPVHQYSLIKEWDFRFSGVTPTASFSSAAKLVFYASRVGEVKCISLKSARELSGFIAIRSDRPLVLSSSANGEYLAAAYEIGTVDIIRLLYNAKGDMRTDGYTRIKHYLVPEYERPFFKFIGSNLYYQQPSGEIALYDPLNNEEKIILGQVINRGELSSLLKLRSHLICSFRHKSGTHVVALPLEDQGRYLQTSFPGRDISAACVGETNQFFMAFTNLEIVEMRVDHKIEVIRKQRAKAAPECMTALRNLLLWVCEGSIHIQPTIQTEDSLEPVSNDNALERSLSVDICGDDEICILSGAIISCYKASEIQKQSKTRFLSIFETKTDSYMALICEKGYVSLLDIGKQTVTPLWNNDKVDFISDIDGMKNLVLIGKNGTGVCCDLSEVAIKPLDRLPSNLQCISGFRSGGFWMVDDCSRLYYLDRSCRISKYWHPPCKDAKGKWISSGRNHLVLCSTQLYTDYPMNQLFFIDIDRRGYDGLYLNGSRTLMMHEIEINNVLWSSNPDIEELFLIGRTEEGCIIKKGTPEQFIEGCEESHVILDLDQVIRRAALDYNGTALWLLSMQGNLFHVRIDDWVVEAILSPADPVKEIVARPMHSQTIVFGTEQAAIFRCSFLTNYNRRGESI